MKNHRHSEDYRAVYCPICSPEKYREAIPQMRQQMHNGLRAVIQSDIANSTVMGLASLMGCLDEDAKFAGADGFPELAAIYTDGAAQAARAERTALEKVADTSWITSKFQTREQRKL